MQKKIIALAVAGLVSGAAFAQSNVTVYGVMDLGYIDARTGNADADNTKSRVGLNSGNLASSRIGFRGTEDLGGGLSANFTIETGLTADDPTATNTQLGNRVSTVGLSGKSWGTISMGRMAHLTHLHDSRYTVLFGTAVDPAGQTSRAAARYGNATPLTETTQNNHAGRYISASQEMHHADRLSNTVAYVSPDMGGFTGAIAYVFIGEDKRVNGAGQRRAWNLSGHYTAGPLSVGAAYMHVGNTTSSTNSNDNGSKQWNLGGSYNFGVAQLRLNYANQKSNLRDSGKATRWDIGTVIPVSSTGNLHIAHSTSKRNTGTGFIGGELKLGGRAWALAYTHSLSKRTTAYAAWGNADNREHAAGGLYGLTLERDKAARALAVGLSHSF